jgi:hypothetical protein
VGLDFVEIPPPSMPVLLFSYTIDMVDFLGPEIGYSFKGQFFSKTEKTKYVSKLANTIYQLTL